MATLHKGDNDAIIIIIIIIIIIYSDKMSTIPRNSLVGTFSKNLIVFPSENHCYK